MSKTGRLKKSPRICFMITTLDFGGAEVQVVELAARLVKRDWEVMIVSLMKSTALVRRAEDAGVIVASLGIAGKRPSPATFIRLGRIVSTWKPDIIHTHMFHANLLGRIYRLCNRTTPLISTIHNIYEGKSVAQTNRRCLAYRFTDQWSDLTTVISHAAYRHHAQKKSAPLKKLLHVPNGIDTDEFRPGGVHSKKKSTFTWLAIGSIEKQKDYPNLIQGFKEVLRSHPNAVLRIVGVGSLHKKMIRLCRQEGVDRKIVWLGRRNRSEILELMRSADAYVMASKWEGLPMVLLEAAASGLPIVATRVGGNSELVCHEKTGFLVPVSRPDRLAKAMLRMMRATETQRRDMGSAGRRRIVNDYDMDRIVSVWEGLYRRCRNNTTGHFRTIDKRCFF